MKQELIKPYTFLMADDDSEDRNLVKEALSECNILNKISFVEDGQELMDYLFNRDKYSDKLLFPKPGIILLDLNMPKKNGHEVLKEIKADNHLRSIPVIVLTTSSSEKDIEKAYNNGVNSFIKKPESFDGLVTAMKSLGKYWIETVELPKNYL